MVIGVHIKRAKSKHTMQLKNVLSRAAELSFPFHLHHFLKVFRAIYDILTYVININMLISESIPRATCC